MLLRSLVIVGLLAFSLAGAEQAHSAERSCANRSGRIVSLQGRVDVLGTGERAWHSAKLHESLCEGDKVRTGRRSRAAIALVNDAILRINQNSTLEVETVEKKSRIGSLLRLITGVIQSFSRRPSGYTVATPAATIGVRGTEFVISAKDGITEVTVFEGQVQASNAAGEVAVASGEQAVILDGKAPERRTVIKPRDLAQWSLYYPPVLSLKKTTLIPATTAWSAAMDEAVSCGSAGDVACAFDALDRIPQQDRSAPYHLLNAALLLSVGQVESARIEVDEAIALDPTAGEAYALRAIVAITNNNGEAALEDANEAVALSPDGLAPKIALSYAQQANLQLEAARETLQQAVDEHPDDPLARARLAELWLATGFSKRALEEAEAANRLAPDFARTQMVLGFIALARLNTETAKTVFTRAIALDTADPLSRLGLGLAMIRQGDLAEGRANIETAVALDSNSSELRAYLGKSYFEEKRYPLDAEQYSVAKELDPNDPTAYLYSGILNQSINRPVEALRDIDESIERNDNRAVYRSRLLLDEDRATRGTSQARVFNNLGFQRLGINQSTRSLSLDPAGAGAHRFLSDTYRSLPRREAARVSELLQAQTMQDININPVQPSIASTSLNIVNNGGPTSTGFSEYTPLFERNRAQFNVTGLYGSNGTLSGEAVLSGVYDRFSGSGGAFSYDTNGFRDNNDLSHTIYDVYAQVAATPEFNLQAEARTRETDRGDIAMNFDPNSFDPNFRQNVEETSYRVGARYSPNVTSDFILSYIYSERDLTGSTSSTQVQVLPPPPFPITITADSSQTTTQTNDANQAEGLYVYKADRFNVSAGAAYARVVTGGSLQANTVFTVVPPIIPLPPASQTFPVDATTNDWRGYAYSNFKVADSVTGTLGLSYQNYDSTLFQIDRFNPKVGVQWDITRTLRARAAYFEGIKPVLASNRTLEPTQVAGFNQLFDDADGTRSKRYGVAFDWRASRDFFAGIEFTGRWLDQPVINLTTNTADFEDRQEVTDRAYLYWTPLKTVALRLEAVYDTFDKDTPSSSATGISKVDTLSFPFTATYFHHSGFFASLGVTYVDQEVQRVATSTLASGEDNFTLVDVGVGYRLPRRTGIFTLGVQNVFNEDFRYQDDSYRTFQDEPSGSPYIPERTIMGTLTLSF